MVCGHKWFELSNPVGAWDLPPHGSGKNNNFIVECAVAYAFVKTGKKGSWAIWCVPKKNRRRDVFQDIQRG